MQKRFWKGIFAVAGKRLLAYQMLLYTGQRKSEVRALVWSDLHLDSDKPYVLFRADTMKDDDKRAVPLRREIAAQLLAARPKDSDPTQRVFWFCWPTYDILRSDFKKAGIVRKDGLGRVVHFHSFRKDNAEPWSPLWYQSKGGTGDSRPLGRQSDCQCLHRCCQSPTA